jgi:hypothetical protein
VPFSFEGVGTSSNAHQTLKIKASLSFDKSGIVKLTAQTHHQNLQEELLCM